MGFGYKTSWIAVRSRTTVEVADALTLGARRSMSFAAGTDAAYEGGVFVTPPIDGWTLAHGRELGDDIDLTGPEFLSWLVEMSRRLGEVQFFGTHRVAEWHQWASARDGVVLRAYAFADGEVALYVGEPTPAEVSCGIGTAPWPGDESEGWGDVEWDRWFSTTPGEQDVMHIAGQWSVDPSLIDDDGVIGSGLFGHLTWH